MEHINNFFVLFCLVLDITRSLCWWQCKIELWRLHHIPVGRSMAKIADWLKDLELGSLRKVNTRSEESQRSSSLRWLWYSLDTIHSIYSTGGGGASELPSTHGAIWNSVLGWYRLIHVLCSLSERCKCILWFLFLPPMSCKERGWSSSIIFLWAYMTGVFPLRGFSPFFNAYWLLDFSGI